MQLIWFIAIICILHGEIILLKIIKRAEPTASCDNILVAWIKVLVKSKMMSLFLLLCTQKATFFIVYASSKEVLLFALFITFGKKNIFAFKIALNFAPTISVLAELHICMILNKTMQFINYMQSNPY